MKAQPACIPCMFRQMENTLAVATDKSAIREQAYRRLASAIADISLDDMPAEICYAVYDIIRDLTGIIDPYKNDKRITNDLALKLLPQLEVMVLDSPDPLRAAVHLAAAGNVIDLGIGHTTDIERDLHEILTVPFTVEDIDDFRSDLVPGKTLLYLGDNSGEIVFDRVLVEQLLKAGLQVTFSVKSGPIINDATREDAEIAGITALVPVIETGSDDIGINWKRCSKEFLAVFQNADIVLSKGQGNFETVSERSGNIYYLLKAKCHSVADELGVAYGNLVFRHVDGR